MTDAVTEEGNLTTRKTRYIPVADKTPAQLQDYQQRHLPAVRQHLQKCQADSIKTAIDHRSPWTAFEIEVVLDATLTSRECTQIIGRTFRAIVNKRRRLREADITTLIDWLDEFPLEHVEDRSNEEWLKWLEDL